jgi:hypothetical protein
VESIMKRLFLLLILVGLGLATWYGLEAAGYLGKSEFSSDPQVAELQRMQKSFGATPDKRPSEAQRKEMYEKMRELSDEQRHEFFESGRRSMEEMMDNRMRKFFTLSPEEQKKQLDEDIDRMQKWRNGGRGGPGGGGPRGEGDRRGGRNEDSKSSQTNAGGEKKEAAKQGDGRGPRDNSPEGRSARRKQMLSHSSPEQRAMRAEYRARMDTRMRERGLQPPTSRG